MDTAWIIIICAVIALFAIGFSVQTIRMNRSRLGRVLNIYRNVRYNENLLSKFAYKGMTSGFQTRAWDDHKYDVEYLPEDLRMDLDTLFEKVHKMNLELGSVIEGRGETALTRVNTDIIKEPLTDMRKRLDEWIRANYKNPEMVPKRLGFLGL